jgi:Na+-transporting NADH:ubiquinone oxidoreductase subunit NqrB
MWAMAQNSILLFFRGKLFADPGKAMTQLLIGILVTALIFIVLAKTGAPVWLAALVAALIGGALQPFLFRKLRFA